MLNRIFRRFWCCVAGCFLIILSSCAVFQSFQSPSAEYRAQLRSLVRENKIFDRGDLVIAAKVVRAMPQRESGPSKFVGKAVVAVHYPVDPALPARSFVFSQGGVALEGWSEVLEPAELQESFPFSYPFYRVFVRTEALSAEPTVISSPSADLVVP